MEKNSESPHSRSANVFVIVVSLIILALGSALSFAMFSKTQLGESTNAAALILVITLIFSGTLLIAVIIRR